MQSKYRLHLGKTQFGCYPFFFIPLPLVGVLVGSACLACWLLGFWESTYSDGWIMDKEKNRTFWRVGCLVCLLLIACVIQWMDGWMDGWMRRCCVNKGGRREGVRGRAQRLPRNANQVSTAFGKTQGCVVLVAGLLVAWWATNAKQVSTAFGENVWSLGLFVAGGLPTLSFNSPSFGWCVGWFSLLGLLVAWVWRRDIQ